MSKLVPTNCFITSTIVADGMSARFRICARMLSTEVSANLRNRGSSVAIPLRRFNTNNSALAATREAREDIACATWASLKKTWASLGQVPWASLKLFEPRNVSNRIYVKMNVFNKLK